MIGYYKEYCFTIDCKNNLFKATSIFSFSFANL